MEIIYFSSLGLSDKCRRKNIIYELIQKPGYEEIGECWECTSYAKDKDGYCKIKIGNKNQRLHRHIYAIHHNQTPGENLVCHKCDNPSCINPDHLFIGTVLDNNKDRDLKGRTSRVGNKGNCKGEKNNRAKLTEKDVLYIKKLLESGNSCKMVANLFNVNSSTIERIKNNKRWTYLKGVV